MKRALLENVKVIPYTLGTAIDRDGFLSAIVAANITAGDSAGIEVTHCDEESGSYVAVPDDFVVLGEKNVSVSGAALVQFYLDLVGCKRYIKVNITGPSTAVYAVALGDAREVPVNVMPPAAAETFASRVGEAVVGKSKVGEE